MQSTGLFLYSDGGPDHRLTYLFVKLSLLSLFLECDLDFSVAVKQHIIIPGEILLNVMSIVNLGLQCVGLMRQKMTDEE